MQSESIALYAASRGLTVVRSYEDAGRSGVTADKRLALQSLLNDVRMGRADFSVILVYDVSRWGRFQDTDESAYYEYLCKEAGVRVEYCAEHFENDGSLTTAVLKNIKRAMAGEFSRDLSVKVFAGQSRSVSSGFFVGSKPGYGLRRCLIDEHGNRKTVMSFGQRKALSTDRTILVPGPPAEVQIVRQVYDWFIDQKMPMRRIARRLNDDGILNAEGRVWTPVAIRQLLTNEKYMGSSVFNRTSKKINTKFRNNNSRDWIRAVLAFEPIVTAERYKKAQQQIADNARAYTDDEMLDTLSALWCRCGQLSASIIETSPGSPRVNAYTERFGTLIGAYRKIGYPVNFSAGKSASVRMMVLAQLVSGLKAQGNEIFHEIGSSRIAIDHELTLAIVSSSTSPECGKNQWLVGGLAAAKPDILVVARVDKNTSAVEDFLLIPLLFLTTGMWLTVTEKRLRRMDAFRSKTLRPIYEMCARRKLVPFGKA